MPVIVVASPKGGAGKTTCAVLLGTEFARRGIDVRLADCDPNACLTIWANKAKLPKGIHLLEDVKEDTIVRQVRDADDDGRIVIVDLQGSASLMMSRAIATADLVLTPMGATSLDAEIGARALALVAVEEEVLGRQIEQAVVLTRTRYIRSRMHKGIERSFREHQVTVVDPPLMERAAYSALFHFGGDLKTMPPQGEMEAARTNATEFAMAVFKLLEEQR